MAQMESGRAGETSAHHLLYNLPRPSRGEAGKAQVFATVTLHAHLGLCPTAQGWGRPSLHLRIPSGFYFHV